jgi:DNA-binding response OmpR family regulator
MDDKVSSLMERLYGIFSLTPDIFIDFDRCLISVHETEFLLTAREVEVLILLVKSPRRYHSTCEIANKVARTTINYAISEHSIEQTISGLGRKLGENGKNTRFIVCRRGIGYGLFF